MPPRFLLVAAAVAMISAAPRITRSQSTPDRPPAPPGAPDSTRDVDPVGTYTISLTAQGNPMTTVARIDKQADGHYGGAVTGDGIPTLPVNSVTVSGNRIRLSVTAPDGGEAIIEMVLTGDDITGQWSMANDGSSLTGKKTP